jgi:hypothetical protein
MKLTVLMILLAAAHSCTKTDSNVVPNCIENAIVTANSNQMVDSVQKRMFKGKEVYLFINSQCCDMTSPVYDADCNKLCDLGGFIGNMNCEGENFDSGSVYISTVWKK